MRVLCTAGRYRGRSGQVLGRVGARKLRIRWDDGGTSDVVKARLLNEASEAAGRWVLAEERRAGRRR